MEQNQPSKDFSMEKAMAFAASPAGRQLLSLLQQKGGSDLNKAQAYAAAGDMEKAKDSLSALLSDPRVLALLRQLEE